MAVPRLPKTTPYAQAWCVLRHCLRDKLISSAGSRSHLLDLQRQAEPMLQFKWQRPMNDPLPKMTEAADVPPTAEPLRSTDLKPTFHQAREGDSAFSEREGRRREVQGEEQLHCLRAAVPSVAESSNGYHGIISFPPLKFRRDKNTHSARPRDESRLI